MSEFSQQAIPGNPTVNHQKALTPEVIESVLGDFRSWLQGLASEGGEILGPPSGEEQPIDLHTLLGQFIALRHEVNLQTRAVRNQQEQNAETLKHLSKALEALEHAQGATEATDDRRGDENLRPVLKTLVDVYDALSLANREARRLQEVILPSLEELTSANVPVPELKLTGLAGWFARGQLEQQTDGKREHKEKVQEATTRIRQFLDSLVTGYTMSLRRLERSLEQAELEPIPCVGRAFDPEQMEVVEVVSGSDRSPGEVIDEVRRGYVWHDRIFRYAQVRVAKI